MDWRQLRLLLDEARNPATLLELSQIESRIAGDVGQLPTEFCCRYLQRCRLLLQLEMDGDLLTRCWTGQPGWWQCGSMGAGDGGRSCSVVQSSGEQLVR